MKKEYKTGDVIWCKLYGDNHIQNGVRPGVIIQNNMGNKFSPTVQIVPLTSRKNKSKLPTHVKIPANIAGLTKDSIAQCEGSRPISKVDILGFIGKLPDDYMAEISVASLISTPIIKYLTQQEVMEVYDRLNIN